MTDDAGLDRLKSRQACQPSWTIRESSSCDCSSALAMAWPGLFWGTITRLRAGSCREEAEPHALSHERRYGRSSAPMPVLFPMEGGASPLSPWPRREFPKGRRTRRYDDQLESSEVVTIAALAPAPGFSKDRL